MWPSRYRIGGITGVGLFYYYIRFVEHAIDWPTTVGQLLVH